MKKIIEIEIRQDASLRISVNGMEAYEVLGTLRMATIAKEEETKSSHQLRDLDEK